MPTLASNGYFISIFINTLLILHDGGHWLECNVEINILTIADTALNASRVVSTRPDFSTFVNKLIVVC